MDKSVYKEIKNILVNIFPIFLKIRDKISILSLCAYRIENKYAKEKLEKYVVINEKNIMLKCYLTKDLNY